MKNRLLITIITLLFINTGINKIAGQNPETSIADFTSEMQKYEGYINFYWDETGDKIWLEVDKLNTEFLYVSSLAAGVGSNDLGLDKGQLGGNKVMKFIRSGPKLLLIQPNYSFRSVSGDKNEKITVDDAFARSVIWGFKIIIEDNSKILVDATDFLMRDSHGISNSLSRRNQGDFRIDNSRSAFYLPRTKNFPENTEFEAIITFTGNATGSYLREVVPSPDAITVRLHHSLIKLPDDEYTPRVFDPRSGYMSFQYNDYSTPLHEPLGKKFILRHRLQKKDPDAKISEAVEPIIYYIDRGAPEPIRTALLEGAKWWNEAFEAAGFKDAFKVELMPEGADLLDVRYNVVQCINRSNRGWSYGGSVHDPRTGEILKGHVSLGFLRARQDFLIAQGLVAAFKNGEVSPEMEELALARIRQLSAHEIGHTIGLVHNYASSSDGRTSVMDYPHPLIRLNNGKIDLSDAYTKKIGEWDIQAIKYGYSDFPPGANEKSELEKILLETTSLGLKYISDQDSRGQGSAHPYSHLWDNGENAVEELSRILEIRKIALENFSEDNIPIGEPFATLENVLVPLYLLHRYQVEAASKTIGGIIYNYGIRGSEEQILEVVPPEEQHKALKTLLLTLQPEALALPDNILSLIPPMPPGYSRDRENFTGYTGLSFDVIALAESAANMTLNLLLNPERAARLVEHNYLDSKQMSLSEMIDELIKSTWKNPDKEDKYLVRFAVNRLVLHHLLRLANDESGFGQVRAIAYNKLLELEKWIFEEAETLADQKMIAFYEFALFEIASYYKDPQSFNLKTNISVPPGSPIGSDYMDWE